MDISSNDSASCSFRKRKENSGNGGGDDQEDLGVREKGTPGKRMGGGVQDTQMNLVVL